MKKIILLATLVLLVGFAIYFFVKKDNNTDYVPILSPADQTITNKMANLVLTHSDELYGYSFSVPEGYTIDVLPRNSPPYQNSDFRGSMSNGKFAYSFSDFDVYKNATFKNYEQVLNTGGEYNALGILYWRSNGSGPGECYEEMDCTAYDDEFQYGARFDLKNNKVLTIAGGVAFRDGKNNHTIEDFKKTDEFKDFYKIIKTVNIK